MAKKVGSKVKMRVAADKASEHTRYTRGVKITAEAPKSVLYNTRPDVKAAADAVMAETVKLKALMDTDATAQAAAKKARTALGEGVVSFDGCLDVYRVTGQKHCVTEDDASSLALDSAQRTKHPLAMPLAVEAKYDVHEDTLPIRVTRAPGMRSVSIQMSGDPFGPGTWVELDGSGAMRTVSKPPPGICWLRAASVTGKAKSDYTTPLQVTVKK